MRWKMLISVWVIAAGPTAFGSIAVNSEDNYAELLKHAQLCSVTTVLSTAPLVIGTRYVITCDGGLVHLPEDLGGNKRAPTPTFFASFGLSETYCTGNTCYYARTAP